MDRLNSLLEEGNQSISINEQGLDKNNNLREEKSHEDFRPIFLMSKKTLHDQGKDVSRALRNRCLLIDVDYVDKEGCYDQDITSAAENVFEQVSKQDSRVLNAHHESLKFDFYPCKDNSLKEDQSLSQKVSLGKRSKPDNLVVPMPMNDSFSESYIFKYL